MHIYIYIYIYINDVLQWVPTHKHISVSRPAFNSSVCILDVVWKTCQERWTLGMDGECEPGKYVLSACPDDMRILIYIYIYRNMWEVHPWTLTCLKTKVILMHPRIYHHIHTRSSLSVTVIIVRNGVGEQSSNPAWGLSLYLNALGKCMNQSFLPSVMDKS